MSTAFFPRTFAWSAVLIFLCLFCPSARAADSTNSAAAPSLRWQRGPGTASLGDLAGLRLPPGYVSLDAGQARQFMEKLGNPPTGREVGVVAPTNLAWFAIFQFDAIGYVPDVEKAQLNADAIFKSVLNANTLVNAERVRRGWPQVRITGWETPPAFNTNSARMEWALRGESGKETSVNHGVRILGRSGVIEVSFVERRRLASNITAFKHLLSGVEFKLGERYQDHQDGDKLAPYGLSGLVTRGEVKAAEGASFLREIHWRMQKFWWLFLIFGLGAGWIAGLLVRIRWITRQMDAMAAHVAGCQLVEMRPGRTTTANGRYARSKPRPTPSHAARMERHFDSYTYYQDLTRDLYRHGR